MTQVFDAYAAYYDLLYRGKDYSGEAAYVDSLLQRHAPGCSDILELGCGTGMHAAELVRRGYKLDGIDLSAVMVERAQARFGGTGDDQTARFTQADLREYRAHRHYDAVLALFHVMSYQTTNRDLAAAMTTAAVHLQPGGIFIFDCWYGPGVLTDPPATRVRRLTGDGIEVTRIAEPAHYPNENRVDVRYEVIVEGNDVRERFVEVHPMRYLFVPEVVLLLEAAGLKLVAVESWLAGGELGCGSWNACFIAVR